MWLSHFSRITAYWYGAWQADWLDVLQFMHSMQWLTLLRMLVLGFPVLALQAQHTAAAVQQLTFGPAFACLPM
jgi:hypothetical protein